MSIMEETDEHLFDDLIVSDDDEELGAEENEQHHQNIDYEEMRLIIDKNEPELNENFWTLICCTIGDYV